MPEAAPLFVPTERQQQAMRGIERYDELGYGGALGGGKTVFICWYAHTLSTLYPGNRGAIFRENLKDLRETTLEEFKIFMARYYPHQPINWRYSPTIECELTCAGGQKSVILWLETKEPEKHLSLNLGWAGFDEASQVSRDAYLIVSGRVGRHLLQDGTRPPCKLAWGSNPGPSWCKQDFPVGAEPARVVKQLDNGSIHTLAFVPALHSDNPHLPADYIPKLRARYPQVWIDRFLKGSWDVFEGQIYTEFDPLRHVYGPSSHDKRVFIHTSMRNMVTMDWGQRVPAACLLVSLDYEGEYWVSREYRAAGRTPAQHAPHIRLLAEGVEVDKWVFDYAAVDQSSGVKIWQMFRDLDQPIPFQGCGKKNKTGADNTVLFLKQLMIDDKIHIHESCAGLIYEITNAKWKPQSAAMAGVKTPKDEPLDIDDHSLDALFMALEDYRKIPVKPTAEAAQAMDRTKQVRRHVEESGNVIPDPEQIDYEGRIAPRRPSSPWQM